MLKTLEQNARRAKEANSFRNYESGSATAEYNSYCEKAEQIAAYAVKQLTEAHAPEDRIEKVNYLLEKYKVKKLEWINAVYSNRASVPSVMIAGPSNFPVRQKERQNAKEDNLFKNNPDYILDQIQSIGSTAGVIRSDDPNAIERIKGKIKDLENSTSDPYGYNKVEIRRLRERLLILAPEEFKEEQENITVNGVKTYPEIVKLWDNGKITKSTYDNKTYYYILPLEFYNGKRRYKELIQIEVDETGENRIDFNFEKRETEKQPLTDELKYFIIIGKISGSGNKSIMYNFFRGLAPSVQAAQQKAEERKESGINETVVINGETAEVVKNQDDMRLQLIFSGKPADETRNILKSNGFRWAPSAKAWQRLLNSNAIYALNSIKKTS